MYFASIFLNVRMETALDSYLLLIEEQTRPNSTSKLFISFEKQGNIVSKFSKEAVSR